MLSPSQIIARVRLNPKIPAPSQTVFRILSMTKRDDCNMQKVAELISSDGGLTAQLLRQANCALFGAMTPTSSVSAACVRLGMKRVRSAVINQHVVNGLKNGRPSAFDPNRFWQSTLAVSVAAQDLSQKLQPEHVEDAGTAGLLCDVGICLLAFGIPPEYEAVLAQYKTKPDAELDKVEVANLNVTHAEVGAYVLADWKLETPIVEAVRHHHDTPDMASHATLGSFERIVGAAVTLSRIALKGTSIDRISLLFNQLESLTSRPESIACDLLDSLVAHVQKAAEAFSVELGSTEEMEENLAGALGAIPDVSKKFTFKPMARESFA